jgi:N-methylhydantoinase A
MRGRLAAQFADMKLPGELVYTHTLDMRFVGQAFEVGVEIPANRVASLDAQYVAELFADAHHRTFMHGATLDRPVEIVTLRVGATLPIGAAPRLDRETLDRAPEKTRIFHDEGWIDCIRHAAEALKPGQEIAGPAVIDGYTATTWVPPLWTATLDASDNLILKRAA